MIKQEDYQAITQQVIDCGSYKELCAVIRERAPFISYSRNTSIEWSADRIISNIKVVRNGGAFINGITRVNGLRSKVAELIMANNYGDNWEE
jgi:hypothetical protein